MLKKLLNKTSIFLGKFTIQAIRFLGAGAGTNLPGKIAGKISPTVLSDLVRQTGKEIIVVSGTNGKTTTSGFLGSILEADSRKIVHNRRGANMLPGITTAVINKSNLNAELDVDNCLFEMDEAYLTRGVEEFNPNFMLITNLFRDQLDRYGELNTTAKKINEAIEKTSKVKPLRLVLNADDPIVSALGENSGSSRIYYGFDEIKFINQDDKITSPQETTNCKCGSRFNYSKVFYGHLGHFMCSCGVKRIEPKVRADVEVDVSGSKLYIKSTESEFEILIRMPGLYNAYNALSAITVALEMGISRKVIQQGLESYSTVFGRAETIQLKGKPVLIQLIKNPIGATEVLRTVKDDKDGKILVIINDDYADGRDVSWLWDANFELLSMYRKQAVVSGVRASDMAVRLKYAGISSENIRIIENIKSALEYSLDNLQSVEKLYILPTYTALLELDRIKKNFL